MTGESLKSKIQGRGFLLRDVATRLGMSAQHLNQALNAADVKSGLLERISEALNIGIAELYGQTPPSTAVTTNNGSIGSIVSGTNNEVRYEPNTAVLQATVELLRNENAWLRSIVERSGYRIDTMRQGT